jgi:hypothetical protein
LWDRIEFETPERGNVEDDRNPDAPAVRTLELVEATQPSRPRSHDRRFAADCVDEALFNLGNRR